MSKKKYRNLHPLSWYIKRIGKRIYRDKDTCACHTCKDAEENGMIIYDVAHAHYLYTVAGDMGILYKDQKDG